MSEGEGREIDERFALEFLVRWELQVTTYKFVQMRLKKVGTNNGTVGNFVTQFFVVL